MAKDRSSKSVPLKLLLNGYIQKNFKCNKATLPSLQLLMNQEIKSDSVSSKISDIKECTLIDNMQEDENIIDIPIIHDTPKNKNVEDFLMPSNSQEVIVIKDEEDFGARTNISLIELNKGTNLLKNILTGGYGRKRKANQCNQDRDDNTNKKTPFEETQEQLSNSLRSTKKSDFNNIFSNFKNENSSKASARHKEQTEEIENSTRCKLRHGISKENELEPPWPKYHCIKGEASFEYKALLLNYKSVAEIVPQAEFCSSEYLTLNRSNKNNQLDTVEYEPIEYIQNYRAPKVIWTENFKPIDLQDVMIASKVKNSVEQWIKSAFNKLKGPTNMKLSCQETICMVEEEFKDSVLDEEDALLSDNDKIGEFVPLMILAGETGKSTLLEIIMEELNGKIYEVNTSSNRGKKNIWENIKELSTTHFVKNTGSQGLIIFDDADILFNERDKNFWSVVEKTLLITRRPILLTCRDINNIPNNFVRIAKEQNSLFHVKKVRKDAIMKYLQSCTKRAGIKVSESVLEDIIEDSNRDIRFCMMQLQWLCTKPGLITKNNASDVKMPLELEDFLINSDLLSNADIMYSNTWNKSNYLHEVDDSLLTSNSKAKYQSEEEFIKHDYLLNYRVHLFDSINAPQLIFELNIAAYIRSCLWDKNEYTLRTKKFFNSFIYESIRYLSSMTKRHTASSTYSGTRLTRSAKKFNHLVEPNTESFNDKKPFFKAYFDFLSTHSSKEICKEFLPFFHILAQISYDTRSNNIKLYQTIKETINRDEIMTRDQILSYMLQNGLPRKLYFTHSPNKLLDIWKEQGNKITSTDT